MAEPLAPYTETTSSGAPIIQKYDAASQIRFPTPEDANRLKQYHYFQQLFMGNHFDAFNMQIASGEYNKAYSQLRYVMVNFAGLLSKIVADFLFSEPITISVPKGDQEFVDALWHGNKMNEQCYESALSNSYAGDAVFKVRVDKRQKYDTERSVIIDDITPFIYFPKVDPFNVRAEPDEIELSWMFFKGNDKFLRKEIHRPGVIENKVYSMKGEFIQAEVGLSSLGIAGIQASVETKIKEMPIVHCVNWKTASRRFGISDYNDLDSLFFAINNRMTKVDNILDKHSDPILIVPDGVLDEKGNVKKHQLGVIEIKDATEGKPEYVVWDASLENAFKEIEKLVEFFYMVGEISPDTFGMGNGQSDSGRALKFKLLRTIAKVARKKVYYDRAIKQTMYLAQLMAKEHGIAINGKQLKGDPVMPEIIWQDGLPVDEIEQMDTETRAVDAELTTREAAIQRIYGVDEKTAEQIAKEARDDRAIPVPSMGFGTPKPGTPGAPAAE